MTYDEWKARDDTPEPEPEWYCDECHHYGRRNDSCGCPCCSELPEHTPGPWSADKMTGGSWCVCTDSGAIADVWTTAQDARLIAAAPELLQALAVLRGACTQAYKAGRIAAEPFVRAGNVIAKAEGK